MMAKHLDPKTVPYTAELFSALIEHQIEYVQIGETVCGAEDPAVITLGEGFAQQYPEFQGFTVARIIDRYVSPWKSDTLVEFSTEETTNTEYSLEQELLGEEG